MATVLVACGDDAMMGEPDAAFICATDNQCDDLVFCNGEEVCAPAAAGADARGCVQQPPPCMEGQMCDEDAQSCETDCSVSGDADGDGVDSMDCGGDDCDDSDDTRYPGNTEICDAEGHDEDCDPMTVGDTDMDGDGVVDAACCNEDSSGTLLCGTDCDDSRPDVSGTAVEACDGADNDCDGDIDEGVLSTWYEDSDGDGFASMAGDAEIMMACEQPTGFAAMRTDCDDSSAASNPSAPEVCDGLDNDCDGTMDEDTAPVSWYRDADGDTYGQPSMTPIDSCELVAGHVTRAGDCDDTDGDINPLAADICDGVDNDCDGMLDGPGEDEDGDGFASMACGGDDCDDDADTVYPGATEICNRIDDDCSSGGGDDVSEDEDDDGFSPNSSSCSAVGGFPKTDCDDTRAEAYPGAPEICNRLDDDCGGGGSNLDEDFDADGYAAPGASCTGGFPKTDCNDGAPSVNPGATDGCELARVDDDCDGVANQTCPSGAWMDLSTSDTDGFPEQCEPGYAVSGYYLRIDTTDAPIRQISALCEPIGVQQTGDDSYIVNLDSTLTTHLADLQSGASTSFTPFHCPDGQFVQSVDLYYNGDMYVDGMRMRCTGLRIVGSPGSWSIELDPLQTSTQTIGLRGGSFGTIACPSGDIGMGINGYVLTNLRSLSLRCGTPELRLGLDGGCADGTREAFPDEAAHPNIAACGGGWGIAGLPGSVSCNRNTGDDRVTQPALGACSAADLCAEGWHVCDDSADVAASSSGCGGVANGLRPEPRDHFYAAAQGGNGTNCTATGTNDIYGCQVIVDTPAPASCAPLDAASGDQCGAIGVGLTCPSSSNELGTVTSDSAANENGVLCCRD